MTQKRGQVERLCYKGDIIGKSTWYVVDSMGVCYY